MKRAERREQMKRDKQLVETTVSAMRLTGSKCSSVRKKCRDNTPVQKWTNGCVLTLLLAIRFGQQGDAGLRKTTYGEEGEQVAMCSRKWATRR